MKMLTTQLSGLLTRLAEREQFSIEETARLLAQAIASDGRIIFYGVDELAAVTMRAQLGEEKMQSVIPYEKGMEFHHTDRVLIMSKREHPEEALQLAKQLHDAFIPFAVIASAKEEDDALAQWAYTYVSTDITRGLLPTETGDRTVYVDLIATLFIFEAMKQMMDEMLHDFEM